MKILVDIGHPAHVHYFRNAIKELERMGHTFLITTRDKEVSIDLLKSYGFKFVCTGKNKSGGINKFFTMLRNDWIIYKEAKKFKPDLILSFFSPFAAHVGRFLKIPVIGFTDSEFAKLSIRLTRPFTDYIFTPYCFWDDFGENHFRFKGFMETFYLHPKYFSPDPGVLDRIGVIDGEKYFVIRFVTFNAGHDFGESGIKMQSKLEIVRYLLTKGKVFISSEGILPEELQLFQIKIDPADFHSVLYYSSLYIGEGITTASECAHLGTPCILINSIRTSYITALEEKKLIHHFTNCAQLLHTTKELTELENVGNIFRERKNKMMSEIIDCTAFLIWLVHNFPKSLNTLKRNPNLHNSPESAKTVR